MHRHSDRVLRGEHESERNSFHEKENMRMNTAVAAGAIRKSAILRITPIEEQPSIVAASSISLGKDLNASLITSTAYGLLELHSAKCQITGLIESSHRLT